MQVSTSGTPRDIQNSNVYRSGTDTRRKKTRSTNKSFPWKSLTVAIISICIGIGIGALISRQRAKSRDVIMAINGNIITKDDFFAQMERAAGQQVMRKMINDELYVQFAKQKGVAPSESEILKAYKGLNTASDKKSDVPSPEVHRTLQVSLSEAAVINKGVTVTDAEVRHFYDQNIDSKNSKALYYHPSSMRIAVIVTSSEAKCNAALSEMAKGMSFGEAAKKYSEDSSKTNGGLLPPILRTTQGSPKIPELENAVFGLKVGGQLGPQKFAGKWWIIHSLDKKQEMTQPFDKVKEQSRMGALLAKGLPQNAKQTQKDFADFQKKANIQAFWKQYEVTPNTK